MLRWPHPNYLLSFLTADEFTDWQDYYELNPWGDNRADLRNAALAAMVLGALGGCDRLPDPLFPYFSDEGAAVDLKATAERLEKHYEKLAGHLARLEQSAVPREPSNVTVEPGQAVNHQAGEV